MKAVRIILGIILLVVSLYNIGSVIFSLDDTEISSQVDKKFTLLSDEVTTDTFGSQYIEGIIQNDTGKDYSYVQVTFRVYDENGNQLGTAIDNINYLKNGATWKYKATPFIFEDFVTYEFEEITGW